LVDGSNTQKKNQNVRLNELPNPKNQKIRTDQLSYPFEKPSPVWVQVSEPTGCPESNENNCTL